MKRYIKASMSDVDLSYDDIQKIEDGLYKIVKKYFSDGRYSHTARIAVTSFKYDSPQYTARPSSGYSNTSASPSMNANSAQLSEFKKLSEYGKLYQRTLEWVLSRPRSEKETSDYLYKKIYEKKLDKEYINQIIEKLEKKKYLNDEAFAKWYVENRFVKKGISKKRLSLELAKKGISREIVERVLKDSGRDEKEEILKIIAKKRARYDDDKLIQYLGRQGFSYELAKDLVLASGTDSQSLE